MGWGDYSDDLVCVFFFFLGGFGWFSWFVVSFFDVDCLFSSAVELDFDYVGWVSAFV